MECAVLPKLWPLWDWERPQTFPPAVHEDLVVIIKDGLNVVVQTPLALPFPPIFLPHKGDGLEGEVQLLCLLLLL